MFKDLFQFLANYSLLITWHVSLLNFRVLSVKIIIQFFFEISILFLIFGVSIHDSFIELWRGCISDHIRCDFATLKEKFRKIRWLKSEFQSGVASFLKFRRSGSQRTIFAKFIIWILVLPTFCFWNNGIKFLLNLMWLRLKVSTFEYVVCCWNLLISINSCTQGRSSLIFIIYFWYLWACKIYRILIYVLQSMDLVLKSNFVSILIFA